MKKFITIAVVVWLLWKAILPNLDLITQGQPVMWGVLMIVIGLPVLVWLIYGLSNVPSAAKSAVRLATPTRQQPELWEPYDDTQETNEPTPAYETRYVRGRSYQQDKSRKMQPNHDPFNLFLGDPCPACGGKRDGREPQCMCVDVETYTFVPQEGDIEID